MAEHIATDAVPPLSIRDFSRDSTTREFDVFALLQAFSKVSKLLVHVLQLCLLIGVHIVSNKSLNLMTNCRLVTGRPQLDKLLA